MNARARAKAATKAVELIAEGMSDSRALEQAGYSHNTATKQARRTINRLCKAEFQQLLEEAGADRKRVAEKIHALMDDEGKVAVNAVRLWCEIFDTVGQTANTQLVAVFADAVRATATKFIPADQRAEFYQFIAERLLATGTLGSQPMQLDAQPTTLPA